jgi:hypothetical protein
VRSAAILMGTKRSLRVRGLFGEFAPPEATLLNDVTYGNYHQFRSESRILTGNIPASDH